MNLLIVLIGISGSGKSLLSEKIKSYFSEVEVICPDELRKELLGDVNDQSNGNFIFKTAGERVFKSTQKNKVTVFDATNTSWSRTKRFVEENSYKSINIFVLMTDSLDPEICKKRVNSDIEKGKDRSRVPSEIIDKQYKGFIDIYKDIDPEEMVYFYKGDFGKFATFIGENIEQSTI